MEWEGAPQRPANIAIILLSLITTAPHRLVGKRFEVLLRNLCDALVDLIH